MLARQANCVHVGQRESEVICNLNLENGFIYTRDYYYESLVQVNVWSARFES